MASRAEPGRSAVSLLVVWGVKKDFSPCFSRAQSFKAYFSEIY